VAAEFSGERARTRTGNFRFQFRQHAGVLAARATPRRARIPQPQREITLATF
jgi:hypothetical protein